MYHETSNSIIRNPSCDMMLYFFKIILWPAFTSPSCRHRSGFYGWTRFWRSCHSANWPSHPEGAGRDQKEKDQRKGQFPRLSCKRSERQLRPMRKCHSPVDFGGTIEQVLVLAHVQAMILGEALTLDLHMVAHVQLMVLQAHGKASNLDLHVWWRSWWFLRHILTCMWSWWHTARRRRLTFTLRHSFKFSLFCSLPARHRVEMRKRNCDSLTSQCHYVFEFVWFSPHLACQPPCLTQSIQVLYSPPPLMMKTRLYQRIVLRTVGLGQCDIKNKEIY